MTIREPHLHDTDPERTPMAAPWPDPLPPDATRDEAMDRAERSCDAYGLLPREARRRAGERWDQEHATTPAAPVIGQQIAESKPCICPITPGYIKHFPWCAKAKATPPAAPDEAAVEALCGIWIQTVLGDEWSAHQRAGCHHPIYSPTVARAILAAIRAGQVPGIYEARHLVGAAGVTHEGQRNIISALTAQVAKLTQRDVALVESAQNAQAMVLRTVEERDALRAQVAKLSGELRMEQGQHAITQEKRKEFEGYADRMCAERDRLSAEVERLKKAYHQRMDEIGAKQSHIAALTGERDAALVRAEKAAALAAGLREERNGLAEENIPLLNRAETAEQDRDQARADLAAMTKRAEAYGQRMNELGEYVRDAHSQEFNERDDASPLIDLIRHAYVELARNSAGLRARVKDLAAMTADRDEAVGWMREIRAYVHRGTRSDCQQAFFTAPTVVRIDAFLARVRP